MKIIYFFSFLFIGLSFTINEANKIDVCFISFKGSKKLTAKSPDKLPKSMAVPRELMTEEGKVKVSRIAGYRVLYLNKKKVPFVNLKVELSESSSYIKDQENLLKNLEYIISNTDGLSSKNSIKKELNGYKLFGMCRNSIKTGNVLSSFILFPGNNITVYIYFNNMKPKERNFKSLNGFIEQRDLFLEEYTKHISNCK